MSDIEQYTNKEDGFLPLVVDSDWQVSILNYTDSQLLDNIDRVEVHQDTDEVFVLLSGDAVLMEVVFNEDAIEKIHATKMLRHTLYNVPKGVWHNIAMKKDAVVVIVEKKNTHKQDVEYHKLQEHEVDKLRELTLKNFMQLT